MGWGRKRGLEAGETTMAALPLMGMPVAGVLAMSCTRPTPPPDMLCVVVDSNFFTALAVKNPSKLILIMLENVSFLIHT